MPRSLIIIPARLASTRLPGKLLLDIAGKSMLQHCWERAMRAGVGDVYIATEDSKIEQAASAFGASVLRTGAHISGTARIAAAIEQLDLQDNDLIINLQGDEPLLPVALIRALHAYATENLDVKLAEKLDNHFGNHSVAACSVCSPLHDSSQLHDPGQVKVVLDYAQRALLFSRAALPWVAGAAAGQAAATLISEQAVYLHHGLYAYTAATLRRWHQLKPGKLEQLESLEQLRLLENGLAISMLVSALDHAELVRLRGVDTAADLQRVRSLLS